MVTNNCKNNVTDTDDKIQLQNVTDTDDRIKWQNDRMWWQNASKFVTNTDDNIW